MTLQIFHQTGHMFSWNIESFQEEATGDGLILSPRHMKKKVVQELDKSLRKRSIFDPQFFVPASIAGKLGTYEFYPKVIAGEFETTEYGETMGPESALECVKFQIYNQFRYVVIPTRFYSGMPSKYIDEQERLFVEPFLAALREYESQAEVLLQLVLNEDMIKDEKYAAEILDWVTYYPRINGVYLIVKRSQIAKQIEDADLLFAMLNFIHGLKLNGLHVVLGYLNTEAVVLSLADPDILTIGSYETTRMFDPRIFEVQEKKQRNPPTPRLYIPLLVQNIDFRYKDALIKHLPDIQLFEENQHKIDMFTPGFNWHFSNPVLYKYYFKVFSQQLKTLGEVKGLDRYHAVSEILQQAATLFTLITKLGVVLDTESDGSHLPAWQTAANLFAGDQGWRHA